MQKDRLEEKLRASLGEYPSPLDLEGAWSALERRRNQNRRRGVWLWWLAGVGICVGILGLVLFGPKEKIQPEFLGATAQQSGKVEQASVEVSEQLPTKELIEENIVKLQPVVNFPDVELKRPDQVASLLERPGHMLGMESKLTLSSTPAEQSLNESVDPVDSDSKENSKFTGTRILNTANRESRPSLPTVKIMPEINFVQDQFEFLSITGRNYRRQKRKQEGFWIGISSTVGVQDRNLGAAEQATAETESLLTKRNSSEKTLESYSFSFDLRRDFGSNWYIQTGLRHQIGFEHFEDQYERTFDKVLEDQVTEIIQRADGSVTELRGQVIVPVTESVKSSMYNTQNLTEIPILLGYQQHFTKDLSFDLNVGLLYGLIQRKEGQVHSLSTDPGQYQSLHELPYRRSNIWGAQLQGSISYVLQDQWIAFGGVQAKNYLNLVKSGETFFERQLSLNAVLGLRFRLR